MAGLYTRFKEFSYEIPKYLLPLSNRTILHHILRSFDCSREFESVLLIANKQDIRFRSQIERTMNEFAFKKKELIFIGNTRGQSETAFEGLSFLLDQAGIGNEPIVIHNVDTILLNRKFTNLENDFENCECLIDVFNANNESYSYVLEDEGIVTTIVEKKIVSDLASSGCYAFNRADIALSYLDKKSNFYISDSIMQMIEDGYIVKTIAVNPESDTFVLGTPEEYTNSMKVFDLAIHS